MIHPYACFAVRDEASFQKQALSLFHYQAKHIPVYKSWLEAIHVNPLKIRHWEDIPYMPVSFFKTHDVHDPATTPMITFYSSGTTRQVPSRHPVTDIHLYEKSFMDTFEMFYGPVSGSCILALLPSYLERKGSSLVYMAEGLIRQSRHPDSGFYLNQYGKLSEVLKMMRERKQKTVLIGVSYALLDMVEQFPLEFPELTVMETGGMKGRRKELIREELHQFLCKGFSVGKIHSEYGMTELLSQAYAQRNGFFQCPPWMRIRIHELNDPFTFVAKGITGAICITDLANAHSCAFIATEDLGRGHEDGFFEVLGRFDASELRGCNLMVQ